MLTSSGVPWRRHSRPLFLKLPTNSFFFVSTDMIGSRAVRNPLACVLMYWNCASRSMCLLPSRVLLLGRRLDQALEITRKRRVLKRLRLAPAAQVADPSGRSRDVVPNIAQPVINRRARHTADPGHQADPTAAQCMRFQRDKPPAALLIQNRGHLPIALACRTRLRSSNHAATLCRSVPLVNPVQDIFSICGNFDSVIYGWALTALVMVRRFASPRKGLQEITVTVHLIPGLGAR